MRTGVLSWILSAFVLFSAGTAVAGESQSLDRILPGIRERHPGKFYDAQGPWRGPDGQMRYRLKWMNPDGRIVWFDADARTGRVIGPGPNYNGPRERRLREEDRYRERYRDERRFEREREGPRWHGGGGGRPHRGRN
jgi:hypothetical protein